MTMLKDGTMIDDNCLGSESERAGTPIPSINQTVLSRHSGT